MSYENIIVHISAAYTGKKTCDIAGRHFHSKYKHEEAVLTYITSGLKNEIMCAKNTPIFFT